MRCEIAQATLAGEQFEPLDEQHIAACATCSALNAELDAIDALALDLPLPTLPPGLADATWAAVEREMRANEPASALPPPGSDANIVQLDARRARRRWSTAAAVAMAAAAAMAIWPAAPPTEPSELIERGVGTRLPDVSLKVAVEHDGGLHRLSQQASYGPGDTLYFRAAVDSDAWLTLVRVTEHRTTAVHRQQVAMGELDLALADGPLAWQLEAGETDAVFALLATPAPMNGDTVEAALSGAYDPSRPAAVCDAASFIGARCSAAFVRVHP